MLLLVQTRFIMNWKIFFLVCFMIQDPCKGGIKPRGIGRVRVRRQVLINNVENGVFHGETKLIDTDPTQSYLYQFPANTDAAASKELEAELAKRLGLSDALEAEERRKLLNSLYGGQDNVDSGKVHNTLYQGQSVEEQLELLKRVTAEKERKDLLTIIQEQQEQEERKKLLNNIMRNKKQERINLINNLYGEKRSITTEEKLLKKIKDEREAEERRKLLNKIYSEEARPITTEDALFKNIKEQQEAIERRKLLNEIYSESRPLTTGDILNSPYLGDKRNLINEIKKLTPSRNRVQSRNTISEMENLIVQLLGLGDALSSSAREVMLKVIYERTQILKNREFC